MATEREEIEIDSGVGGAAASSFQNSQTGSSINPSVVLREEDIPGASLDGREPSQLHVVELKRWLKCRGATTAGRKQDLVKRVKDYIAAGLDTRIIDPDGGVHINRLQAEATKGTQSPVIPKILPQDGWTSRLEKLPPFNYGCLYAHLVISSKTIAENQCIKATAEYRAGAMKHKEEGYRLFKDDHVKRVRFHPGSTQENHCLFHVTVKPSFKTTGSYSVVIALCKVSGNVVGANCKCKAGAGGCCKHVAALLYNILDYTELGLTAIPDDKTCTDKPQQWNKPSTSAQDTKVLFSDIQFVHHSFGKHKAEEMKTRMEKYKKYRACPVSLQLLSEEHIRRFCTSLDSQQNSVLFTKVLRGNDCKPIPFLTPPTTITGSSSSKNQLSPIVSSGPSPMSLNSSLSKEEILWKRISVTAEKAKEIEIKTRGQSVSPDWYEERRWRITASFFGRVCKRRPTTPPAALVNSIINQRIPKSVPPSCAWGIDNEDAAINAYKAKQHEMGHTNLTIVKPGLFINPDFAWLGATPDGLVTDLSLPDPDGLLEIKCPYSFREVTPLDAASNKAFFCRQENGELFLKEEHQYHYQVQGQMAVCSRKWCDFVVYTSAGISIQRIKFKEDFWKTMLPVMRRFYDTAIVPKLIEKS